MATSKKSTGETLFDPTSYAGGTPANHSAKRAKDKAKKTNDTYGHGLKTPLAYYDPDTQSWRMCEATLPLAEPPLLESLPKSGMTQNGELYQQPAWEPITDETGLSSWPTPVASSSMTEDTATVRERLENGKPYKARLVEAVALWPTPTASDWKGRGPNSKQQGLPEAVKKAEGIWPTPTYGKLAGGSGGMAQIEAQYSAGNINDEERRAMRAGNGGKLNPEWVEWLMGFPTGWTDLED
jgi:hypothetical protein